jgi:hypothetical protein
MNLSAPGDRGVVVGGNAIHPGAAARRIDQALDVDRESIVVIPKQRVSPATDLPAPVTSTA